MTETAALQQAQQAWFRYRDAVNWTPEQKASASFSDIGAAYVRGWLDRDDRDIEPTKIGTIILLRYHDDSATPVVMYDRGWARVGSDSYEPWRKLLDDVESWELVWEPSS